MTKMYDNTHRDELVIRFVDLQSLLIIYYETVFTLWNLNQGFIRSEILRVCSHVRFEHGIRSKFRIQI